MCVDYSTAAPVIHLLEPAYPTVFENIMTTNQAIPPDALLLIAPGCPHCGAVMQNLSTLAKENAIGRLEIVKIASHPEVAEKAGTRSVPWMRIGSVELTGLHSLPEIREWVSRAEEKESPELEQMAKKMIT